MNMMWWKHLTRFVVATIIAVLGLLSLLTRNTVMGEITNLTIISETILTVALSAVILELGIKNFIENRGG